MFLSVRCSQGKILPSIRFGARNIGLYSASIHSVPSKLHPFALSSRTPQLQRCFKPTLFKRQSSHPSRLIEDRNVSKSTPPPTKRSILSRLFPSAGEDAAKSASSFRSIVALAKPEKKPLGIAIGLLLISSSVSMTIPLTVGKLIDYFTSPVPVRSSSYFQYAEINEFCVANTFRFVFRASRSYPSRDVHRGSVC
jgi:hypothetical protein